MSRNSIVDVNVDRGVHSIVTMKSGFFMDEIGVGEFVHVFAKSWGVGNTFSVLTKAYKQFTIKFGHLILRKNL